MYWLVVCLRVIRYLIGLWIRVALLIWCLFCLNWLFAFGLAVCVMFALICFSLSLRLRWFCCFIL